MLPLKETVVFPESMTPLAIGQERSIKLIDDVVAGERLLALVTVKNEDAETPGFDDLYDVGTAAIVHKMIRVPDGTLRILVQGVQRIKLEKRVGEDPYLVAEFAELPDVLVESREVEALTRNVQGLFARVIALVPYLPEELQIAAANVDDPSALCHLVASTLRLKTEEKQKLLELVNVDRAPARDLEDPEPRARGLRTGDENPVAGPVRDGEGPARVLPPPAAEGDPGRARRRRCRAGRDQRAARAPRRAAAAGGRRPRGAPRAGAPREAAVGGGRVRRHPHVSRVDHLAALEPDDRGQARPRRGAEDPRRGSLRPREGEGTHHRVPRRLEAEARGLRSDPLLRRSARRRQDVTREVDRAHARPQVHAHLRRRRARRGRDPRSPAHVHRRDARHDHPLAARRRVEEPRDADRRDRQDGRRLPRRSRVGDARGARPGAELVVPRPLPRPAVRPVQGAVHLHREHARHGSRPAARPHGRHPAFRLHRGREARHREEVPLPEAAEGARPDEVAARRVGHDAAPRHPRVHA